MLVYDKTTGVILGGQTAGYAGADRRLDVIATAAANKLTVNDLSDIDFAYSPPLGTANDALNMAAYTAENKMSGFSPSVTALELDAFVADNNPVFVDVRDVFAYEKSHIMGALHIPLELLAEKAGSIPKNRPVVVYDETGKKGHQALRTLVGAGFADVTNVSGGHASLQRQARAIGFKNIDLGLIPVEKKSMADKTEAEHDTSTEKQAEQPSNKPLIVDVRTREEFNTGAVPGAVNIPLDELMYRYEEELGNQPDRDITVYCASGARSAYAQQMLMQIGYNNVKNGGGVSAMMARVRAAVQPKAEPKQAANEPLIIDVRTRGEFLGGAYPGAINIELDQLASRANELGDKSRDITLYCASGARSAYGQRLLQQMGFTNVKNGGGLMHMMMRR